jgi:hypothetical protein
MIYLCDEIEKHMKTVKKQLEAAEAKVKARRARIEARMLTNRIKQLKKCWTKTSDAKS